MDKRLIYADHAATTQLSEAAFQAMLPYLREEFGNPSSLHSYAKLPRRAVAETRKTVADCIGAEPEQIFFTSGGTESDNWVVKMFGARGVVASGFEHHAVLNSCAAVQDRGCKTGYIPVTREGLVLPDRVLDEVLRLETEDALATVMLANNEIGTIQPVAEIVRLLRGRNRVKIHTDAVQAVGNIHVDVKDLDVDFLSASAHKFNGPRGIGFLYVKNPSELRPYIDGGQQEFGMRAGTENVAAIVGMAAALRENVEALDRNMAHKRRLAEKLRGRISEECPSAHFNGGADMRLPGFVSVSFRGKSAEGIMRILDLKGIAVSTGAACDSKNTRISHVLKAIALEDDLAKGTLRVTLGKENTEEDVDRIVAALCLAKAFLPEA